MEGSGWIVLCSIAADFQLGMSAGFASFPQRKLGIAGFPTWLDRCVWEEGVSRSVRNQIF